MSPSDEELRKTVSEHAVQLGVVTSHLGEIKDTIKEIAKVIQHQDKLLHKLSSIEESFEGSKNRIHNILDKHEKKLEEHDKVIDSMCPVVDINMKALSERVDKIDKLTDHFNTVATVSIPNMDRALTNIEGKLKILEPVLFFMKYPKLTVAFAVGSYIVAFEPSRKALISVIGG